MFTKFASMLGDGDSLSITITKKGDNLITSILPKKADLSDTGKDYLSPLVVSGTPEELENGFIDAVITPIQQATGILTNMREFEKGVEAAEANSKA
ncbi:PRTRC system protein E, partial [Bacteroides pyogenes]